MPKEDPVVPWGNTMLCNGPLFKFGVVAAGQTPIPIPISGLRHPPIYSSYSMCSMYSPSDSSCASVGGTKTSLQANDTVRVLILAHP